MEALRQAPNFLFISSGEARVLINDPTKLFADKIKRPLSPPSSASPPPPPAAPSKHQHLISIWNSLLSRGSYMWPYMCSISGRVRAANCALDTALGPL